MARPLRLALLASLLALLAACSTAPAKTDTVTTVKTQAAQNATYGDGYYKQGRYDLALGLYTQALSQYTSVDDGPGIVAAYNDIALTYMALGRYDAAEPLLLTARERARSVSDALVVTTTITLGELYLARGDGATALATFRQALAMPAAALTPASTAILDHDSGTAQKSLGDLPGALASFQASLKINRENDLTAEAASDYYMIASVYSLQASYDEALANANLALSLDKKIESSPGIAKDLYALGLIATKKGDLAAAFDYFQRSYLVFVTLGATADEKKALVGLIAAADGLKRTADADQYRAILAGLGGA